MDPARQETDKRDEDASLIRWMLSLTPSERLDVLQETVNSILELRRNARGSARARVGKSQPTFFSGNSPPRVRAGSAGRRQWRA